MPRMKRLKGFAHDIALQFSMSAEHFAAMARALRIPTVIIDLKSGAIYPADFDILRNRVLVGMCQESLERMQAREGLPHLPAASITATFALEGPETHSIECAVTDATGHVHRGSFVFPPR